MDDRISFLPLEIRDHILSFLPTEDAIKTSVLSTSWRNVCSTLSKLFFRHRSSLSEENFVKYVCQTLSHRDINSSISTFRVSLFVTNPNVFGSHLTSWASFAANCNAREVILNVYDGPNLPLSLFTSSSSLTILVLSNVNLTFPAKSPLRFPNLRYLSLEEVHFIDVNETNQLLLSSVVLQTLRIIGCSWKIPFDMLTVPDPKLLPLWHQAPHTFNQIQLSSTNLRKLKYEDCRPPVFSINWFSSIEDATFIVPRNVIDPWAANILKGLDNVIDLCLGGFFLELLVTQGELLLSQLPASGWSHLRCLSLTLYPTKNHVRVIILMLRRCPLLQSLNIKVLKGNGMDPNTLNDGDYWEKEELHVNYMLKQLQSVKIEWCGESEVEIELVRYLLENGPALKTMDIMLWWSVKEISSFYEKLRKYIEVPPFVTVEYSWICHTASPDLIG